MLPLVNGDAAYPEMLRAIGEAKKTVTLSVYIFDNDRAGLMFAEALGQAVARGVDVRVLVDDVGARYSIPSIEHVLRQHEVRMARFLPTSLPGRFVYANLRNHRKIMVVDGHEGFTGGLNIREGHYLALNPSHPIQDLHFRIRGPAVAHLQEVFLRRLGVCHRRDAVGRRLVCRRGELWAGAVPGHHQRPRRRSGQAAAGTVGSHRLRRKKHLDRQPLFLARRNAGGRVERGGAAGGASRHRAAGQK